MTETLTAGSEEFTLESGTLSESTWEADKPTELIILQAATGLMPVEIMRERVQEAEIRARSTIAREFANQAAGIDAVREVWLDESGREAILHVVVEEDVGLDKELELEAVLTAVLSGRPRFDGFLYVHRPSEGDGPYGQRLFPE